jgi:hypothetical protein
MPHGAAVRCGVQGSRLCIEDAVSMMDDVALPAEYQSAILELTNSMLAALKESARDRWPPTLAQRCTAFASHTICLPKH